LAIMMKKGVTLAELSKVMVVFPQTQRNIRVKNKRDLSQIREIQQMVEEFKRLLGERGRILIRYSGTEPVVRIMVEGEDEVKISRMADAMAETVQNTLG